MKKIFTLITMMLLATMSSMATTYTVVGVKAIINGDESWNPALELNDMSSDDGNLYTLTVSGKNLEKNATGYEWKIAEDHAWAKSYPQNGNEHLIISEDGKYDITYTLDLAADNWSAVATKVGPYEQPTEDKHYTVAGSEAAIFGTAWTPSNKDNEMEKQADGTFAFSVEGVDLAAGTVKYKVCVDYDWGESYGDPSSGDPDGNALLIIPEDGNYNVTFTFDPSTKEVSASFEKAGEAVIEKDYFVAGQEALMGVNWDPSYADNQMTENEDGTYSLSFSATLTAGENYQFKVVTNGDWEQPSFGDDTESGNYEFTVDEDGDYDITITFDPATEEITITLEKDTTGIGTVQSSKLNVQSTIYNLRGQRVNASTRGILIINGKKVVVK